MKHFTDDDLTLYYYGEGRRRVAIERHLQHCEACAALYREIAGTLALVVGDEVPERGDQYGLEVWQHIRPRLSERTPGVERWFGESWLAAWSWRGLTLAAGMAALALAAFIAGYAVNSRSRAQKPDAQAIAQPAANPSTRGTPADAETGRRILLTSVADHLDRSARVLTDIMNESTTATSHDISVEQRWAEDLITTSRLYRQDALDAGERSVAAVLDELERNLLEVVHSPSTISAADLEQIRRRIDAAALLFKVRVMSDELRQRESPAEQRASATPPSKIS